MKNESFLQVGRVVGLARVMPKERFVASLTHNFLVLEQAADDDGLGYDTSYISTDDALDLPSSDPANSLTIIELVKTRSNPFADRISIGRATNCDVVLNDSSVSKLHAHIRESEGELVLVDIGSQNGTFINGERLDPHAARPVKLGDRLQFGTVAGRVADAAAVFDLVHAKSR